ncbi:S41 family peptidase [Paraglaciecola marina]|uniref:S41 family peptidase n=1 Tax=Paraglaciecola marina TaxID=2500157 RepID=UPI00105C73C0|nr:S41 family peptidase [Paraglaciecola marina]
MKVLTYLLLSVLIFISQYGFATQLLREPSLKNDLLVFAYANDIWKVTLKGGTATRITSFQGQESSPKISPNGNWIAFTGEYNGNNDVYIVSSLGGEPKRLTYHPTNDQVVGWSPDGQTVLFNSRRDNAPRSWQRLYTIDINGGNPSLLPMNRAFSGSYSPDTKHLVFRRAGFWDKGWRNYRGGQNQALRVIKLDDLEEYDLPFNNDLDSDPIWQGDDIYYLSNHSKVTNVFKYSTTNKQVSQITHSTKFDVMGYTIDGDNLVYEYHGDLYLQTGTANPQKIAINVKGDFHWATNKYVKAEDHITEFDVSPNAKRAVFAARGDIFTVPVEHGSPRNLTDNSASRQVSPAWSHDGQFIAWFSDDTGEYRLNIADQKGNIAKEIKLAEKGFYNELQWSPDNKRLIFSDNFQQLWIANADNGSTKIIAQNAITHPEPSAMAAWSPDSKWVAYTQQTNNMFRQLLIYSVTERKSYTVTEGIAEIRSPVWDKNGERLYFLASTDYGPKAAWLDMSTVAFNPSFQIYYALLTNKYDSPLLEKSDEEEATQQAGEEESKENSEDAEKSIVSVTVDFENLHKRILPLSKESGHFSQLQTGKSGELFYVSQYENNSGETKTDLIRYELETQKTNTLASDINTYKISSNGESLLAKSQAGWSVFNSATGSGKDDKVLKLALPKRVNYSQEWQQIFREAWRYQRDYLYVDNFHGADWEEVYQLYSPLVASVKHPADLTYLLDNIGAEVSIGHSYTSTGELPYQGKNYVGLLGADYKIDDNGVQIAKVYTGESYYPTQNSQAPLAKVAHKIRDNDYLLKVNGTSIDPNQNIYQYFQGTLGQVTSITVGNSKRPKDLQTFNIVPIADETALRRNEWVENNRKYVDKQSDGKLAYVWIPNTAEDGYHSFNRYFYSQSDKQGVILDERFNHGGFIANYIIDVLRREPSGFFNNPFAKANPMTSPGSGVWGPKVMLINEVSGSGGDMLPYMFRHYKLGKLIGKRTWGGLVGIWGVPPLIDGGYITAPRSGFFDLQGQWKVENEGVAPDINVEQWTKYTVKGRDPQLDAGIKEALSELSGYQSPVITEPKPPIRVPNPIQ